MGALAIAFDITIVGALALSWVLLVVRLLFVNGENRLGKVLDWVKDQEQPAVVGVLLFAMTYTLGSAVSRIGRIFSMTMTSTFRLMGTYFVSARPKTASIRESIATWTTAICCGLGRKIQVSQERSTLSRP